MRELKFVVCANVKVDIQNSLVKNYVALSFHSRLNLWQTVSLGIRMKLGYNLTI